MAIKYALVRSGHQLSLIMAQGVDKYSVEYNIYEKAEGWMNKKNNGNGCDCKTS